MSNQYISNSNIYQVNAERDVSVILNQFNADYIYDCIDNALLMKTQTQFIMQNPNLVRSLEDNFVIMKQQFPYDIKNIEDSREELYNEIIHYLCPKFNLVFNDNDVIDLYSAAYYLYDFLIGDYFNLLTKFYAKYILREKDTLYKALNLEKMKKMTNINYGKKIIKDPTITSILVNTSYILDQIIAFDFDFETILNTVYDDPSISRFMSSIFQDNGYFLNFYKQDIFNPSLKAMIVTNIRLFIQDKYIREEDIISTFTIKGE